MVGRSIRPFVYTIYAIYLFSTSDAVQRSDKEEKGGGSKTISKQTNAHLSAYSKDWYRCDFESGYCGWKNDTTAEFEWYRTSEETPTAETGPRWDHTKAGETGSGYYIYIETSVPRKNGDHARLISPTLRESGPFCFRFWHNMHGTDVKDLNIKIKGEESGLETTIAHLSGPWSVGTNSRSMAGENTDWWNQESIDLDVNEPINIIIEGISGKNYKGDIAIDDIELKKGNCPRQSSYCNFENNTCGWTQMTEDEFNWLPNRGRTQTLKTGPMNDHTLKTEQGRYLYIETSWPRVEGDKARLLSPKIECDKGAKPIFNFWYNMNGAHTGPLKVFVTNNKVQLGDALWEKTGDQGSQWILGQVLIPADVVDKGPFHVIVEAERKNFEGDIAIDDLSVGACSASDEDARFPNTIITTTASTTTLELVTVPHMKLFDDGPALLPDNINCAFERGNLCGWKQDVKDDVDWEIFQKRTPSSGTGPSSDHTTGHGWFIYLEASSAKNKQYSTILSPAINQKFQTCVSFFYHMKGKSMGMLEVMSVQSGGTKFTREWMKDTEQSRNDTDWIFAQVTIKESMPYQIAFRATRGSGFQSDIALDDIKVEGRPCDDEKPKNDNTIVKPTLAERPGTNEHPLTCDFTTTTCQWQQAKGKNKDFDWDLATSSTTHLDGTGPKSDHTSGSRDGYIFIDASRHKIGFRASLVSSQFKIDGPKCFRFWYHMHGTGIGDLTIFRLIKKKMAIIWKSKGEKGNQWLEGMIDLQGNHIFSLVITATRGSDWKGDIALDDFSITGGKCPTMTCDFETDNCGWIQETQDDQFNWTRRRGPTPSKNTGPSHDHTMKNANGTYLYLEASKKQRFDEAWLMSPIIDPKDSTPKCLSFWYHSFGENVGTIKVYSMPPNENGKYLGSSRWSNFKNQGNQWLFTEITINEALPYKVIIKGTIGLDYLGDIAIDDIRLRDEACDPCCWPSKFRCGNNYCISNTKRCNGYDDCGDDSDESFCDSSAPGAKPVCGMPSATPVIPELTDDHENILRDETVLEEFDMPVEGRQSPKRPNNVWTGAMRIPLNQTLWLKYPTFVRGSSLKPDIRNFRGTGDINFFDGFRAETINSARKRRSAGDFDDDEDDDEEMIDILKIHERHANAKNMKKEYLSSRDYEFLEIKKHVLKSYGKSHKISASAWDIMRGNKRMTKSRRKRSVKKIIGGARASPRNYPWQVAYYITDSSANPTAHFFCGGTLIDRYWVLTAAHCPYLGDLHNVVLGDYDLFDDEGTEQEMLVDAIFLRNNFQVTQDKNNDIALIKLRYPARQTPAVQLACILGNNQEPFAEGHPCVTTGWGRRVANKRGIERHLRQAEMPIIANSVCKATFWSSFEIHDSYICAGGSGENSCKGDSGGPLVCKRQDDGLFYLAGITSWGDAYCKTTVPGVFTRVQSFNDWIHRIISRHESCANKP